MHLFHSPESSSGLPNSPFDPTPNGISLGELILIAALAAMGAIGVCAVLITLSYAFMELFQ